MPPPPPSAARAPWYQLVRQVFGSRRMAALLLLGFSSGLPLALVSSTLQGWLTVQGASLKAIGLATLVGQAYVFKFLWAPAIDRVEPPGLTAWLGRRRAWLLPLQLALAASLAAMAWVGPDATLPAMLRALLPADVTPAHLALLPLVLLAVLTAVLSASQDVVIDAYRTDLLPREERGAGAAMLVLGYRVAMLVSGGLGLWLAAEVLGWQGMYLLMAAAMALLTLGTLLAPPPPGHAAAPPSLRAAVVEPAREFFSRRGAAALLLAVVLYKLGDAFAGALTTTFLIRGAGFGAGEVGLVYKTMGLVATIGGALLGGALLARLGLWRALVAFGLTQGLANLAYWALAWWAQASAAHAAWAVALQPHALALMAAAVGVENFTAGMGTAAFVAFLSALCDSRYSATQFALLSALAAVGRVYVGPVSGELVTSWGWSGFYLFSVVAGLPGVLMLLWLRRVIETEDAEHAPEPG